MPGSGGNTATDGGTSQKGAAGVPVTASNFRGDVRVRGTITSADVKLVKGAEGHRSVTRAGARRTTPRDLLANENQVGEGDEHHRRGDDLRQIPGIKRGGSRPLDKRCRAMPTVLAQD